MSSNPLRKIIKPILAIVCPTVGCILVGLASFGPGVFSPKTPSFQFIGVGLVVSILVLAAQRLPPAQFVVIAILFTIGMIASTGSWSPRLVPRVIVVMLAMAGAAFLNVKIIMKTRVAKVLGRFITWSIVFILAYLLAGVVLLVIFRPKKMTNFLFIYGQYSVLIGVGLGIGFGAKEWLINKLIKEPRPKTQD